MSYFRIILTSFVWLGFAVHGWAESGSLKILSYNIHHGEGVDGRLDLGRIAKVITDSGADLVALQEVDLVTRRTGGSDQAVELGRLTGLHAYFGKAMDYQGGAYGQALLSRWRLEELTVHALPNPAVREPRIALAAVVRAQGLKPFRIVGTHLDANRDGAVRVLQARELVRLFASDPMPTLLVGDFNAPPESLPMEVLRESFTDAAAARPEPTIPAEHPTRRIDFVLFRPSDQWTPLASSVLVEPVASDHRPVLVSLVLKP